MQKDSKYLIIGAGLTGLSAAYHLGGNYTVFEKENTVGGLCRTVEKNGFFFDYSGHLLHLRNEYTRNLVASILPDAFNEHYRQAHIYFRHQEVPFPFQAHLSVLPTDVKKECLLGFIRAYCEKKPEQPETFKGWVNTHLGEGLAKHFFVPYNTKLYGEDLHRLTPEWCERYVPKPNLEEMVDGALGDQTHVFGYNASFIYPKRGGIQVLADSLAGKVKRVKLGVTVRTIRWKQKVLSTDNGTAYSYDSLISTMPLPELVDALDPIPDDVKAARDMLRWRTVHCINIGVRKTGGSTSHWAYFPESEYVFYRIGFIHNICRYSVPEGYSAYYVEVARDPDEEIECDELVTRSVKDMKKVGILEERDRIAETHYLQLRYAYVVYDLSRTAAVNVIRDFLEQQGILSVGRYGEWKYSAMENALLDGKAVAERIIS
jgi:protoporphyrinogen oxidase